MGGEEFRAQARLHLANRVGFEPEQLGPVLPGIAPEARFQTRLRCKLCCAPAVLLCNLGTPEAPTAAAVRPYLREFLGDPRVVEAYLGQAASAARG